MTTAETSTLYNEIMGGIDGFMQAMSVCTHHFVDVQFTIHQCFSVVCFVLCAVCCFMSRLNFMSSLLLRRTATGPQKVFLGMFSIALTTMRQDHNMKLLEESAQEQQKKKSKTARQKHKAAARSRMSAQEFSLQLHKELAAFVLQQREQESRRAGKPQPATPSSHAVSKQHLCTSRRHGRVSPSPARAGSPHAVVASVVGPANSPMT